ncbi:MAG: tol-pal system protein YbgF [Pseudomonadota bacterium]|nr:tol-pal system protein YbgF [Pseudomonadota bacterium]
MLRHRINAVTGAGLVALMAVASVPETYAQGRKLEDLLNKIERLERDMRVINRQVFRGNAPSALTASPSPTVPASAAGNRLRTAYAARIEARLADLENEIRSATGNIENFNHSMTRLSSRLDKLVADLELRLSDMEKRLFDAAARTQAVPLQSGQPGFQAGTPSGPLSQQITSVVRPPAVIQAGPATGRPSFARPPQRIGAISPSDLAPIRGQTGQPLQAEGQPTPGLQTPVLRPAGPAAPKEQNVLPMGTVQDRYRFAQDLVHRAEYEKAAQAFREFINAHPDHAFVSNARYWLGRTYYVRREYRAAAEAFLKGFRADPKGNKAPDNLLSLGMSLSQMDKKADACAMFSKLTTDFPNAPARITRLLKRERGNADCG